MRRTKIIATVGPATESPDALAAVIGAGVDVVRLNAAHAGPGELAGRLAAIREVEAELGRHIGVLLDLPGPKIRIGEVAEGTVLEQGAVFTLVPGEFVGDASRASISYTRLAQDLDAGDRLLLDDGRIELSVVGTGSTDVRTKVEVGGPLLSNKGVNVPGVTLGVDAITRYDTTLVAWAQANDIDFIGQSFVRSAKDVDDLRGLMTKRLIPIVAKIEKHEADKDLEAIIATADAVMVARGDLGVETSPEAVPVIQRRITRAARRAGKPAVIATQMLDSMTNSPRPTRAEASDVASAIFQRADAVMLSGETAVGLYPEKAVETMGRIALAAEESVYGQGWERMHNHELGVQEAVSAAVCDLAADLRLAAIVPVTQSGATARAVARHRPDTPIVAAAPSPEVARKLALVWGVETVLLPFADETDALLEDVVQALKDSRAASPGERVAITAGRAQRTPGGTNFILVHDI